jgi:hypothetical protein
MSKMREAFNVWWDKFAKQHGFDLTMDEDAWGRPIYKHSHVAAIYDGAFAGYQAAIAAVKEGGPVGYCAVIPVPNGTYRYALTEEKPSAIGVAWSFPIYKLPEALT